MRYLYCHPLFDERKCAHRFSFQLKCTFEAAGLALERFDYRGTGEAEGDFADVSLDTLRRDVAAQIASDDVCIIGLRFGAALAFDHCVRSTTRVRNLVLLAPILNGAQYVDYLCRKQRIKDLMTGAPDAQPADRRYRNLEGYKTSVKFLEQISTINLLEMAAECPLRSSVFVAQISNQLVLDPKIVAFAESLKGSAEQVLVENFDLPMFWERIPSADNAKLTQSVLRCSRG
jgi:alpha/beta superfamily hydrolase